MRELAERSYFLLCSGVGRLLRSARYSKTLIVYQEGELQVRKSRAFYAPLLVSMSRPLVRALDTGVRVLPQPEWETRERVLYQRLANTSIRVDSHKTLVLPRLPGKTLAAWLDNPKLDESGRKRAIELAVVSLSEFHRAGFTHGDAMAENVMIDLDAGVAHWFDFETVHDSSRPIAWRRADDVRALLTTTLVRLPRAELGDALRLIVNSYADEEVAQFLASSFSSMWQRPLAFHLAQATLTYQRYREISTFLGA